MADMQANDARLKWISDYKKHFCHGQPNTRINTDISTGHVHEGLDHTRSHQYVNKTGKLAKVVPPYVAQSRRRTKSAPPIRYSVGDCLVWPSTSSATVQHSSQNSNEKALQKELTPRPPTSKRPIESTFSPRPPGYQSKSNLEPKNMTPAATAISSFVPVSPPEYSKDFEMTNGSSVVNFTRPTVVVN